MARKKQEGASESDETTNEAGSTSDDGTEMLRKLSVKTICGDQKAPEKATGLFQCYGVAQGLRTGNTTYGPWLAFTGNFEAVRSKDGRKFFGTQIFLPEPAQSMMAGHLKVAQEEDKTATIAFAFEIGIKPNDTPVGYEYTIKPLIKPSGNDPLAALRQQLAALPAPAR